jgi:superfamily II DNA or RNA helicase
MELRTYQLTDCEAIRGAFSSGSKSPLYVLPTGGGKTVVLSHIVKAAVGKGARVLVLVHRRELLEQSMRALSREGLEVGAIAPGFPASSHVVQVGSVQTVARRLSKLRPDAFTLIVIDEAHHAVAGSWQKLLQHFQGAKRLGVTATPARLDGRGLAGSFDVMVQGPSARELERAGYLARSVVYAPPIGFNAAAVRTRMGEYDLDEAGKQVSSVRALGDVVQHYQQLLTGGTAIAFCCTVKHAEAVAETFVAAGVSSESIDGSMTWEQREDKLRRLERGELKVLTSCMLIGEGVDVPSVNGCILLRPTKSLSLFLQMVGRCLRPAAGKDRAIVLDHVGNYERHGHHMDRREWTLEEGVKKREGRETGPSLWVCPSCYCNVESRVVECPECGHVRPRQERQVIQVDGELVQLDSNSELEDRACTWGKSTELLPLDPVIVAHPDKGDLRGWFVVDQQSASDELLIVSDTRGSVTNLNLLYAMANSGRIEKGPLCIEVERGLLRRDPDAYLQLLMREQDEMLTRSEQQEERRRSNAEYMAKMQRREEQSKAQTYEELVAVGRRRGMKHPTGWAMKVLQARQYSREYRKRQHA